MTGTTDLGAAPETTCRTRLIRSTRTTRGTAIAP